MKRNLLISARKGEKIISVYWFAILFIVAAAIAYMVLSFYGKPYDVREIEADALTDLVVQCLTDSGRISEGVLSGGKLSENFKTDFAETCKINLETEDVFKWREIGQYLVEVKFYNFDSNTLFGELSEGNAGLKTECNLPGNNFPVCLERSLYTIDSENNQYRIDILSIVRKAEKNVG